MISPDGGHTKLALFEGEPQGERATAGYHRVAFRLAAAEWMAFTDHLTDLKIGESGTTGRIVDHGAAWSVYFSDPYGHRLEVTTYEVEAVRRARGGTGLIRLGAEPGRG